jgi:hypothetical protein
VRRLAVFVIPETGPIRPRALVLTRLHPSPSVLACVSLPAPKEDPPSGVSILEQLAFCMLRPRALQRWPQHPMILQARQQLLTQPGELQKDEAFAVAPPSPHRPATVVFEDSSLAYTCAETLKAAGVATALLRSPPPLRHFLLTFSEGLKQRGVAGNFPLNGRPGILDSTDVRPSMARAFFNLAREFATANPWIVIPDKQTFRIRMEAPGVQGGPMAAEPVVAWACVMGYSTFQMRQMLAKKGAPQLPPWQRSIVVFFKRYDAEMKLLRGPQPRDSPVVPVPPPAEMNPLDAVCAACGKRGSTGSLPSPPRAAGGGGAGAASNAGASASAAAETPRAVLL